MLLLCRSFVITCLVVQSVLAFDFLFIPITSQRLKIPTFQQASSFSPTSIVQGTLKLDRQHARYIIVASDPCFDRMMGLHAPSPSHSGTCVDTGADTWAQTRTPFDFIDMSDHQLLSQILESLSAPAPAQSIAKKAKGPKKSNPRSARPHLTSRSLQQKKHHGARRDEKGKAKAVFPRLPISESSSTRSYLSTLTVCRLHLKDATGETFEAEITFKCNDKYIYWHQKRCAC